MQAIVAMSFVSGAVIATLLSREYARWQQQLARRRFIEKATLVNSVVQAIAREQACIEQANIDGMAPFIPE